MASAVASPMAGMLMRMSKRALRFESAWKSARKAVSIAAI
jgi:hypothetical protein